LIHSRTRIRIDFVWLDLIVCIHSRVDIVQHDLNEIFAELDDIVRHRRDEYSHEAFENLYLSGILKIE